MRGVVAAGHELTAKAGLEMLLSGGNAFDAAVAAAFASFAAESALTSPAGGGFFLALPAGASPVVYDFFVDVPGRGGAGRKKGFNFFSVFIGFVNADQELHIGEGSAAVPGTMAGLEEVIKRHCALPLKKLMAPAIRHAREGVRLNATQAYFNRLLAPMLKSSPEALGVYAQGGRFLEEGEVLKNPLMAAAFELMAEEGLGVFYNGDIAARILEGFSEKGLITAEDLFGYRVVERRPLRFSYRGLDILTNPPPSSGGSLMAFSLKLLEGFDVASLGHNTAGCLGLLSSVMRVTNEARREVFDAAVREEGAGEKLLDPSVIRAYSQRLGASGEPLSGASRPSPGNTTQISVIDEMGNAASLTTSVGIGSGFMIPGTGIMMNNMLGEEDLNPHGFHRDAPGARLSSMMAPTAALSKGRPAIVLGSGGSKRIRGAIAQVLLNIIDHRLPADRAVNAPRVHIEGSTLDLEHGISNAAASALEAEDIHLKRWGSMSMYFGGVHTAVSGPDGFSGAGDRRRGGAALMSS